MIQIVLPRVATDNDLRIGATVVAGEGLADVRKAEDEIYRRISRGFHKDSVAYAPVLPGKDTAIGRGRIAAALRVDQKLRIANVPIDALQVSRIALPFAEGNARVVDKQLMAPGSGRETGN